jgi:hypothetical protein
MHEELSPAAALAWDQALLAPIIEINERMLEQLHQAARSSTGAYACAGEGNVPPLVAQLLTEWCALDAVAQHRLAQCPYLLLDAGFGEPSRWQSGARWRCMRPAPRRSSDTGFLPTRPGLRWCVARCCWAGIWRVRIRWRRGCCSA